MVDFPLSTTGRQLYIDFSTEPSSHTVWQMAELNDVLVIHSGFVFPMEVVLDILKMC